MNKQQYAKFHKYLAMLIYEYNEAFYNENLSEETKIRIENILQALETVMKICIIDGDDKK